MTVSTATPFSQKKITLILLISICFLPLSDYVLPAELQFAELMRPIFIFAILGLGLNVMTGLTGMLNLGIAAFMAIGAYTYAIFTCDIYPFQVGFWWGILLACVAAAAAGTLLGIPTTRLRGDYLAIVTLGFGEIVQDILRNLESITKGTQGINPLPGPSIFGLTFNQDSYLPWYYLLLTILLLVVALNHNLIHARTGRAWRAVREDELAARCMGISSGHARLLAFAFGSALAGLAGGLWAGFLGSSGEPGNYDFQISIITLCLLIVGGMGNIFGVLVGALIMIGFNSIILVKLSQFMNSAGWVSTTNVFTQPNNWKYMIFGMALILMMRYRPQGICPEVIYEKSQSSKLIIEKKYS
jgi:branched-chain amino acid transport system permease protein